MKAAGGAMAGRGPAAPRTPWERSGSVHSCPADVTWPRPPMGARGGALLKGQRGSGGAHMEGGRSPRVGLRRPRPHSYPRGTRGVKGPLTPSSPPSLSFMKRRGKGGGGAANGGGGRGVAVPTRSAAGMGGSARRALRERV